MQPCAQGSIAFGGQILGQWTADVPEQLPLNGVGFGHQIGRRRQRVDGAYPAATIPQIDILPRMRRGPPARAFRVGDRRDHRAVVTDGVGI